MRKLSYQVRKRKRKNTDILKAVKIGLLSSAVILTFMFFLLLWTI